jgi:hypothetical protein
MASTQRPGALMLIDTDDKRLSRIERQTIRQIAYRLEGGSAPSNTPLARRTFTSRPRLHALPDTYTAELDRVFGDCCGEPVDRWQPEGAGKSSRPSTEGPAGQSIFHKRPCFPVFVN